MNIHTGLEVKPHYLWPVTINQVHGYILSVFKQDGTLFEVDDLFKQSLVTPLQVRGRKCSCMGGRLDSVSLKPLKIDSGLIPGGSPCKLRDISKLRPFSELHLPICKMN